MKHGSLFSGYGGLNMAIEEVLGARTAWVSDIDPGACKVLAHRYPDVPNLGDITTVDWANVDPVDIISGGSPCPDLSTAGRRAGMHPGTRSGLWESMREAIAVLRPALVIWENVRGAYSASAHSDLEHCPGCMGDPTDGRPALRALGRVLGDLSDLGYDAVWCGLRASDVGACHGRFRVFVLAVDADRATCDQRRLAADGEAPGGRAWPDAGGPDRAPLSLLPTLRTENNENRQSEDRYGANLGMVLGTTPGYDSRWGEYAEAIARQERTFGRPAPEPTRPGKNGQPRLSAAFAEWMMGLPAGWITDTPGITRNEALKACGNGVVPQQAAAALRYALPLLTAVAA